MIRRIELLNFMSHARTVIEPANGLTVLVGPNNCGKSAIVAALQILCHNDNSTYVTRHNERECSVTVETDDGHVIVWSRKNNSPRYTINGQPFDRLERGGIPDGLHAVLRLPKVIADRDREFDVHFGEQKSPVFLVDRPGSHAAQFFASSSDTASLIEMQKRHQLKMVEARRERIQMEARADKLAVDLAVLAATDQIEIDVAEVETQYEELGLLATTVGQLTVDVRALENMLLLYDHHQSRVAACAMLTPPPTVMNPQPLEEMVEALTRTERDTQRQSTRTSILLALPSCPDIPDERPLVKLITDLQSAQLISTRREDECFETRKLVTPPVMTDFFTLMTTVTEIEAMSRAVVASEERLMALAELAPAPELDNEIFLAQDTLALTQAIAAVGRAEAAHGQLVTLIAVPNLSDTREIDDMIADLERATTALASHAGDLLKAEQAMREGEQLLRAWAKQQQLCPTCGTPLDPNLVVVHAGSCIGGYAHA